MDYSVIRQEHYLEAERAKFNWHKLLMRYRLFGRDGINDREFQKLVDMDIITSTGE